MVNITSSEEQPQEEVGKEQKKQRGDSHQDELTPKKLIVGLTVLIVLGWGVYSIFLSGGSGDGGPQQQASERDRTLSRGDTGIINRLEDKTHCELSTALGVSRDDQERITDLSIAGDQIGLTEMVFAGRAFIVENCTEALVIGTAFGVREVRITDTASEHFGRSGWLPIEWVRAK